MQRNRFKNHSRRLALNSRTPRPRLLLLCAGGATYTTGIYGSDHARIKRVDFVEDGETLDVVLEELG